MKEKHELNQHFKWKDNKMLHVCSMCNDTEYYCSCGFSGCINDEGDEATFHRNILIERRGKEK